MDLIPREVVRAPGGCAGRMVCIYVTVAAGGAVQEHAAAAMKTWQSSGFDVIAVVVTDSIRSPVDLGPLEHCEGILIRENAGHDFAAWAAALQCMPQAWDANTVAFANDAAFGPFSGFGELLSRVDASNAGLVGVVESLEVRRHFQSWLLFFRDSALRHPAVRDFWSGVENLTRVEVIQRYETQLIDLLERRGVTTEALFPRSSFPGPDSLNPTISRWRELMGMGCCFLKVKVLSQNPHSSELSGWRDVVRSVDGDVSLIERALPQDAPAHRIP